MLSERSSAAGSRVLGVLATVAAAVAGWHCGARVSTPAVLGLLCLACAFIIWGETRGVVPYLSLLPLALSSGLAIAFLPPTPQVMQAALVGGLGGALVGAGDVLVLVIAAPVVPCVSLTVGVSVILRGILALRWRVRAAPALEFSAATIAVLGGVSWRILSSWLW